MYMEIPSAQLNVEAHLLFKDLTRCHQKQKEFPTDSWPSKEIFLKGVHWNCPNSNTSCRIDPRDNYAISVPHTFVIPNYIFEAALVVADAGSTGVLLNRLGRNKEDPLREGTLTSV